MKIVLMDIVRALLTFHLLAAAPLVTNPAAFVGVLPSHSRHRLRVLYASRHFYRWYVQPPSPV